MPKRDWKSCATAAEKQELSDLDDLIKKLSGDLSMLRWKRLKIFNRLYARARRKK